METVGSGDWVLIDVNHGGLDHSRRTLFLEYEVNPSQTVRICFSAKIA